jgi:hypothetical protein
MSTDTLVWPTDIATLHARIKAVAEASDSLAAAGLRVDDCEVDLVRPRRDGNLDVVCLMTLRRGDAAQSDTARILATFYRRRERAEQHSRRLVTRDEGRGTGTRSSTPRIVAFDADLGLLLHSTEAQSAEIAAALDVSRMTRTLRESRVRVHGVGEVVTVRRVDVLNHNTQAQRFTARYQLDCEGPASGQVRNVSCIGKSYRTADSAAYVWASMASLRDHGFGDGGSDGITVPRPVATIPGLNMILMEDVPGASLNGNWLSPSTREHLDRAGRALAKLHACGLRVARDHTAHDEVYAISMAAARAIKVVPAEARAFQESFADAVVPAAQFTRRGGVIHGSFHSRHVLYDGARTTLLDLDNIRNGDPAKDVGKFLAMLTWTAIRHSWSVEELRSRGDVFLHGYGQTRQVGAGGAIEFYYRSALLQRAYFALLRPRERGLLSEDAHRYLHASPWRSIQP